MIEPGVSGAPPAAWEDVVVLIPVYNNEAGLVRTLRSIAGAGPYQVVVVDDGSTPPVSRSLAVGGPPPVVIRNVKNGGVAVALNLGLTRILGERRWKYVARLDAGDTVHPKRFERQRQRLETDPQLGIISSWVRYVDRMREDRTFVYRPPSGMARVRRAMRVRSVLIHPAVMFRLDVFREGSLYSTGFPACEDYELLRRLLRRYQGDNIPEVLTECEQNAGGVSRSQRRRQLLAKLRVQALNWEWAPSSVLGIGLTVAGLFAPWSLVAAMRHWRAWRWLTYAQREAPAGSDAAADS